jgi:hypothetical protein
MSDSREAFEAAMRADGWTEQNFEITPAGIGQYFVGWEGER